MQSALLSAAGASKSAESEGRLKKTASTSSLRAEEEDDDDAEAAAEAAEGAVVFTDARNFSLPPSWGKWARGRLAAPAKCAAV